MREAGLDVDLRVEGERRPLPAGVDLSAFRIVQEALTNTLKHAGPAHAHVTVRYGPGEIEVEVVDDGAPAGPAGRGHGLLGMRERAAVVGGRVETGPRTGRGYAVRALAADMTVRVLIADDQELVRTGFRKILESEPDLEVIAEAADGGEAVEAALLHRPDVVLMDVRMPRLDGIEATRKIAGMTRVLMLTTFDLDEYVFEAIRAGASGFLLKDTPADELVRAIHVDRSRRSAAGAVDHAPARRGVRAPSPALRAARGARRADAARARSARARRTRPLEPRDRRRARRR